MLKFPRAGSKRKLGDILGKIEFNIQRIIEDLEGIDKKDFVQNRILRNSVFMDIATIGELLKAVTFNVNNENIEDPDPYGLMQTFPNVDWMGFKEFKDKYFQDDFSIDVNRVWAIATFSLQTLNESISTIRKDYPDIASYMDTTIQQILNFNKRVIAEAESSKELKIESESDDSCPSFF